MSFRRLSAAMVAASLFITPALAGDSTGLMIHDPYARASSPVAKSGAAFMQIMNGTAVDDRLVAARTDAAKRVELHTHIENAEGVMRMVEIADGIPVPAGATAMLRRGGDHVMLMGLTGPLNDGDVITVTLVFEQAGEVTVEIPVDLKRKPAAAHHGDHSHGSHGDDS